MNYDEEYYGRKNLTHSEDLANYYIKKCSEPDSEENHQWKPPVNIGIDDSPPPYPIPENDSQIVANIKNDLSTIGMDLDEILRDAASQCKKDGLYIDKAKQALCGELISSWGIPLSQAPLIVDKYIAENGYSEPSIKCLLIKPDQYPEKIEIKNELSDLQNAVNGNIEVIYPFDDRVGIICNEEGKMNGSSLNRALYESDGNIYDVLSGDFLVVGLTSDDFCSLTSEQMNDYENMFHQPEVFLNIGGHIKAFKMPDNMVNVPVDQNNTVDCIKKDHKNEQSL